MTQSLVETTSTPRKVKRDRGSVTAIAAGLTGLAAILLALQGATRADDWPQWRGPQRDAVSHEGGLLGEWPEGGPPLAWKATGVGTGYASVVISGGRVFTIGQREPDLLATSLNETDGSIVWSRKIGETSRNSCSTPTIDGDRLYALDPDGELVCIHLETGDIVWERSLVEDFGGKMMSGRGYGESPLIDGERLICSPGGPDAAMVALDKQTGDVIWQAKVPELGKAGRDGMGFSSAVVAEIAGVRQYVQLMGRGLVGIEAQNGAWLWGYNDISNDTANIPTPVVRGDLVFAANGYNAGSVLLRVSPEGGADSTDSNWHAKVVYSLKGNQFQNHHGGVALVGDYIYGGHGSNNGLPTCLELGSGRVLWKQRGPGVGSAAVVAADGRLYFRYQDGLVALLEPQESGFEVRGTLQVPDAGGDSWSHPVVANGRLYLREQDSLWVYDVRRQSNDAPELTASDRSAEMPRPLVALHESGLSISALDAGSPPLYRYAIHHDDTDQQTVFVIRLTDRQLDGDGLLTADCMTGLQASSSPMILDLRGTQLSADGLRQLAMLPNVAGLNLELCGAVRDETAASLQPLDKLRVLILAGTGVTAAGIRELKPLEQLTALDLDVCDAIGDEACPELAHLSGLRALVLKKTGFEKDRVSDVGLEHLSRLRKLELLNLYGNRVPDAGLAHLQSFAETLRELDLSLLPLTDAGMVHLQPLKKLQRLDVLYSVGFLGPKLTDASADSLVSLTKLRSLNLTGATLTDAGLSRLHGLHELTSLRLVHTEVTESGIDGLKAALPQCNVVVSLTDAEPSR